MSRTARIVGAAMLGAAAIAVAGVVLTNNTPATDEFGFPIEPAQGESCPLTGDQEKQAVAAFKAMMPVFQHPRCSNCHGGVDPYQEDGRHLGGAMTFYTVTQGGTRVSDFDRNERQCAGCHSKFPHWTVPDPALGFVGKDAAALCMQMKAMGSADAFIDHIERDRGRDPFIGEAFRGTRGLDDAGIAVLEGETDRKFKPEPPPISHSAFLVQAKGWIAALGGEFVGDERCGCVLNGDTIDLTSRGTENLPAGGSFHTLGNYKIIIHEDQTITGEGEQRDWLEMPGCEVHDAEKKFTYSITGRRENGELILNIEPIGTTSKAIRPSIKCALTSAWSTQSETMHAQAAQIRIPDRDGTVLTHKFGMNGTGTLEMKYVKTQK